MQSKNNSLSYTRPAKNEPAAQKTEASNTTVVLLSGESGNRMKSYGPHILQKIPNGETLIEYQVRTIKKHIPYCEIILSYNENADKLSKKIPDCVRIVENQLRDTNEVEEMRLCINNTTTDNILFICSDMFFDDKMFSCINNKSFHKGRSFLIYENRGMIGSDSIGITIVRNRATILSYGLEKKWGRIFFAGKDDIKSLKNFCREPNNKRLFMHEAVNKLLEKGSMAAYNPECLLYRVESLGDIRKIPEGV